MKELIKVIKADLLRRDHTLKDKKLLFFFYRMWFDNGFKALFWYRVTKRYGHNILLKPFLYLIYRRYTYKRGISLAISQKIGQGFYIAHGQFPLMINGEIGDNCTVHQFVTIGANWNKGAPVIGNNVMIGSGAQVIGNVAIGDNAVIGAGAVVTKNVPPNCTVVGVPAYIVVRDGLKVKEFL